MREIKFRVWDKDEKKLEQVGAIDWTETSKGLEVLTCNTETNKHYMTEPDQFILMQFTGLHDKNGKEIYEGDVVKVSGHTYEDNFTAEVTEKRGGYWIDRDYLGNWREYMLKVIGNIYENPELLKGV